MDQKTARFGLRAIILISTFLGFIGLAISFADESFLPKELAAWNEAQKPEDASVILLLITGIPVVIATYASLVGMFIFKKWGAWLYLVTSVIASMFLLVEPSVESGISAFFSDLDSVLGGVILGIAFFSSALEPDQAP
jgi:hypothetical protein